MSTKKEPFLGNAQGHRAFLDDIEFPIILKRQQQLRDCEVRFLYSIS